MKSNSKQLRCEKSAALKKAMVKKRYEIQGGVQEMAVKVGYGKKFNNDNSGEFCAKTKRHQIHLNCHY